MQFRTLSADVIQPSLAVSASGVSAETRSVKAAKGIEVFIDVTAAAAMDYDFDLEVAIEPFGTSPTPNFVKVKTVNGTGVDVLTLVVSRDDFALGRQARVVWTKNGGTATFKITMGRME